MAASEKETLSVNIIKQAIDKFIVEEQNFTSVRGSLPQDYAKIGRGLLKVTNRQSGDLLVASEESIEALIASATQMASRSPMFNNLESLADMDEVISYGHNEVPESIQKLDLQMME